MINIQIIYALPEDPFLIECQMADNSTVAQALNQSRLLQDKNIDLNKHQLGIYGRKVLPDEQLKDGDRIEIYRPLINDPKEIRRKKARKNLNKTI